MTEEESIFDPTMKKKKKKKTKTPFDIEAALSGNAAEDGETNDRDIQEPPVEEEELENFDPEKEKKKKKKSKPLNLDDIENALPDTDGINNDGGGPDESKAMEEDLDLDMDFTKAKKKKKKKNLDELVAEEEAEKVEDKDSAEDSTLTWSGSDRDYTYDELLTRVFDILREKNPDMAAGKKQKFVMRPPQVVRIGTKKTSFANFADFCKTLHRMPKHLLDFLLAELGTSGSVDGNNQLIIKGRFQQKQIESVLRRYIKEYVTCHTCRSPDTILRKDTRLFFLQCETCGSRCSVASIKSGFQAVTGKRAAIRAKTA